MAMKDFAVTKPRPLPVLILADISGSMSVDGKIDALNQSLRDMVKSFAEESRLRAEIHLGLITFGGQAQAHLPLMPAHQIQGIQELQASGATPLGEALTLAREMIEDKELVPSRAYRPVLILASDGLPTDDWEGPFQAFQVSERAKKATRFALAIGNDADEALLRGFGNDLEAPLFHAHNAAEIRRFFRAVTMSVTAHSRSQNPGQKLQLNYRQTDSDEEFDLDDLP